MSFWIGCGAVVLSLLSAAALAGLLLLLLPAGVDGAWVVIAFTALWFGLFFLSYPWQRRYARSLDSRRPGARLDGRLLTIPVGGDDAPTCFDLDEPHELTFGWFEVVTKSTGGPTTNTRSVMTYAILSQAGRALFLQAEDSMREAQSAGWPQRTSSTTPDLRVRLWACDLVTLVEAVRSHAPPAPREPETTTQPTHDDAPQELIREWPENPLPARNRHEVSLFLEWLKVELVSRAPAVGGEVCVGRIRGSDPAAAPDTFRLVFTLSEAADPEDENDFGGGLSRIFDPAELILLLSRMEREGLFAAGANDVRDDPTHVVTYKTTREIEALRRANARGVALIEQALRFAGGDGNLSEESIKSSALRTWARRTSDRFDAGSLKTRRQALTENLELLRLPLTDEAGARKQALLVRELRALCPEYLAELQRAGFEGGQVLHPWFSHGHHLTRYAARALRDGRPAEARAAFDAWSAAEPVETLFPTREFADAVYKLGVEPGTAGSLIPEVNRHAFSTYYDSLLDPGYNPWSY